MYCPTCTTTPLILAQRQGVEIDFCPHCRGVWLDRGELDKLLDLAVRSLPGQAPVVPDERGELLDERRRPRRGRRRDTRLSEIFD
jgi:uncharacterized protein